MMDTPYHQFINSIEIYRPTHFKEAGSNITKYALTGSISCLFCPGGGREDDELGAVRTLDMALVLCDPLDDISDNDYIKYNDTINDDNSYWRITHSHTDSRAALRRLELEKFGPEIPITDSEYIDPEAFDSDEQP
jgi:hypothetical protein